MPGPTVATPLAAEPFNSLQQSDYISARALALGVAETIGIPAGAYGVLLACTDNFVAKIQNGTNGVTPAAWPTDVDDGTMAGELNPAFRRLKSTDTVISVIANSTCVLTASFFVQQNKQS